MPARFDTQAIRLDAIERSPSGVRVPAIPTRAGVFPYARADGSIVREWRPESEVFRDDSMRSLEDVPVTIGHPREGVNPDNFGALTQGNIRAGSVRKDEAVKGIACVVQVSRRDGISKLEKRELHDLSCGYDCRVDETAGVVPAGHADAGKPYDRVQRDIVYNHVAMLPKGGGRQGTTCSLRLDAYDNQLPESEETPPNADGTPVDSSQPTKPGNKAGKKSNEGEPMTPEEKAKQEATEKEATEQKARADALEAQVKAHARGALEATARVILGAEHKFDARDSDRKVRELALAHAKVRFDAADSDAKIEARFDVAIEAARSGTPTAPTHQDAGALNAAFVTGNGGAFKRDADLEAARARADKSRQDSLTTWRADSAPAKRSDGHNTTR